RAASECGPQTGDRRPVSNTCLHLELAVPHPAHRLDRQKIQLVRVGAAPAPTDAFAAVDRVPLVVLLDESSIARVFHFTRDLVERLIPRDVFPVVGAGAAHLWFQETTVVQDVLFERSALRAERAAVDRVV